MVGSKFSQMTVEPELSQKIDRCELSQRAIDINERQEAARGLEQILPTGHKMTDMYVKTKRNASAPPTYNPEE